MTGRTGPSVCRSARAPSSTPVGKMAAGTHARDRPGRRVLRFAARALIVVGGRRTRQEVEQMGPVGRGRIASFALAHACLLPATAARADEPSAAPGLVTTTPLRLSRLGEPSDATTLAPAVAALPLRL